MVAHGADGQPARQRAAVFAPLLHLALPGAAAAHRGPQLGKVGRGGQAIDPLAQFTPLHFLGAEAQPLLKRRVDGQYPPLAVGDGDQVAGVREHAGGQAAFFQVALFARQGALHAPGQGARDQQQRSQGQGRNQCQAACLPLPGAQHLLARGLRQHKPGVAARGAKGRQLRFLTIGLRPLCGADLALQNVFQPALRGQHGAGLFIFSTGKQQRAVVGIDAVVQWRRHLVVACRVDEVVAVDSGHQQPLRCLGQHQGDGEKARIHHRPWLAFVRPGAAVGKVAPAPGMAKAQHARCARHDLRQLRLQRELVPQVGRLGADDHRALRIQRRQGAQIRQLVLQRHQGVFQLLRLAGQVGVLCRQGAQVHVQQVEALRQVLFQTARLLLRVLEHVVQRQTAQVRAGGPHPCGHGQRQQQLQTDQQQKRAARQALRCGHARRSALWQGP